MPANIRLLAEDLKVEIQALPAFLASAGGMADTVSCTLTLAMHSGRPPGAVELLDEMETARVAGSGRVL